MKNNNNNNNKTNKQKETTTTTITTTNQCYQSLKSFSRRKECSQNPGRFFLKRPEEDLLSSQAVDYKSETQLKTRPLTDILQKPHPDLELYLYVLEMHEHLFFKKLALNGCFIKKKEKNNKKNKDKKRATTTITITTTATQNN